MAKKTKTKKSNAKKSKTKSRQFYSEIGKKGGSTKTPAKAKSKSKKKRKKSAPSSSTRELLSDISSVIKRKVKRAI